MGVVCCFCPWGFVPQGKLFFCSQGFVPQEKLFFSPWGFFPQGKFGRPMLPRSPAHCASGFFPPREAGTADVAALASKLCLKVSSPKGSWGDRCCRALQRIVPRGFISQGKLGRLMLPRSPANCASEFRPQREAGVASMMPRSPVGEGLIFFLFLPGVLYH